MAEFTWLVKRLQAMSMPEVIWRLNQKAIQKNEQKQFRDTKSDVTSRLFDRKLNVLKINEKRMCLHIGNGKYGLNTSISLLGGFNYSNYKKEWHAGFQTKNDWPLEFSYSLKYKQRDDIGDARTNWELNRHFQFAILAKNYAASHDKKYLDEFTELFEDWNEKNPFLWGISWTSVMEIAIRCSNWCYSYCFLKLADAPEKLLDQLQTGILNMTDYITKHYSRYSSANNHLIVEAYAIGQTGILCDYQPWIKLAVDILTRELPLQNYSDGVNKELSLHYQSFYMEAMGLMMRLLIKNGIDVPESWKPWLEKMCTYVADCMGDYGEAVVFGDDDEGKILDLQGGIENHYKYTLGLLSVMLDRQYTDLSRLNCENLNWLFTEEEYRDVQKKLLYCSPLCACYREGGNTLLRSKDKRILIGIDHAAVGFGSIAAHGHADALNFQMYVDGQPVFADPGTYIYHCDLNSRNAFRKTENHNTVTVDGKDQSEMLGAFLWGKKANCKLTEINWDSYGQVIEAEHNGYDPIQIKRRFEFDNKRTLVITDMVGGRANIVVSFILGLSVQIINLQKQEVVLQTGGNNIIISIKTKDVEFFPKIKSVPVSLRYGKLDLSQALQIYLESLDQTNVCYEIKLL